MSLSLVHRLLHSTSGWCIPVMDLSRVSGTIVHLLPSPEPLVRVGSKQGKTDARCIVCLVYSLFRYAIVLEYISTSSTWFASVSDRLLLEQWYLSNAIQHNKFVVFFTRRCLCISGMYLWLRLLTQVERI